MQATEQRFPLELFLCPMKWIKVVGLRVKFSGEILKCDQSSETY